jgi:hypothetical protein
LTGAGRRRSLPVEPLTLERMGRCFTGLLPLCFAFLLVTQAAHAQWADSTYRVFRTSAPPLIDRLDIVSGQAAGWGIIWPPDWGLPGPLVQVAEESGGHLACDSLTDHSGVAGNIAFIERGTCEFGVKALNVQRAGAIAFAIYNHDLNATESDSFLAYMGPGAVGDQVTIPGVFIPRYLRDVIIPLLKEGTWMHACLAPAPLKGSGHCYIPSAIEPSGPLTGSHEVFAARPNPFSAATEFGVRMATTQDVRVEVFNALGQRVALLHDGALAAGDVHAFSLAAAALPSGVYLYRVTGETFVETRPVVLAR